MVCSLPTGPHSSRVLLVCFAWKSRGAAEKVGLSALSVCSVVHKVGDTSGGKNELEKGEVGSSPELCL